eukprot:1157639-Pelagomonas_calceolata.AAC.4
MQQAYLNQTCSSFSGNLNACGLWACIDFSLSLPQPCMPLNTDAVIIPLGTFSLLTWFSFFSFRYPFYQSCAQTSGILQVHNSLLLSFVVEGAHGSSEPTCVPSLMSGEFLLPKLMSNFFQLALANSRGMRDEERKATITHYKWFYANAWSHTRHALAGYTKDIASGKILKAT